MIDHQSGLRLLVHLDDFAVQHELGLVWSLEALIDEGEEAREADTCEPAVLADAHKSVAHVVACEFLCAVGDIYL